MGDFRKASWYTVEVTGSPAVTTYTHDGDWGVYAPAGTYNVKVSLKSPDETDAVVLQERTVVVTWGPEYYLRLKSVSIASRARTRIPSFRMYVDTCLFRRCLSSVRRSVWQAIAVAR